MIEKKLFSTGVVPERAILVSVAPPRQSDFVTQEYLDELSFLASTSGVVEVARFTQKLDRPDHRFYVGKGKMEEVQEAVATLEPDMLIFDDDLNSSQVRNLESQFKIKILDRSLLILNIFAFRAQTAQAKLQVELAQYQYLMPRLTRMWTHLSKQRGGVGMRGPGEKELETDRRIVQDRIAWLKEKLRGIDRQAVTRRSGRERIVRVAIVGYTNVGKSTLMNLLSKSDVFAENKLFATVDSTVRKVVYNQVPFLVTDTVGFIRKLPTHLIESFKSTLDEVREADILVHVVDISHPFFEQHMEVTKGILADLKVADKPTVLVFNKVDALDHLPEFPEEVNALANPFELQGLSGVPVRQAIPSRQELRETWLARGNRNVVFISAAQRLHIDELRQVLYENVVEKHMTIFPNFLKPKPQLEDVFYSEK